MAIASSIPPSQAWFFWKTWTTTRGWRPSRRRVARAWLKYASVYHPARIFSTGRSKISGARRVLGGCGMLELEARGERRLGHLELLGARLRGREAVLELVPGLRQRLRQRMRRVAGHPAEELRRGRERAELRGDLGVPAQPLGRQAGQGVAEGGGGDERSHQVAAAALVLARGALAVLVAADRDVLRPVIGRQLARAQREHRGDDGGDGREQLARERAQSRLPQTAHDDGRAEHRGQRAGLLERQLRRRQLRLDLGQQGERLRETGGAAEERVGDPRGPEPLARRRDLDLAVLAPDGARPGGRPVDEHAVGQGHPAEPELLLRHRAEA